MANVEVMGRANSVVARLLESPAHHILSGTTILVRYSGRRTGTEYTTPVQYAEAGQGLVVLVGDADAKTWWRNFTEMGQMQVLLRGEWIPMTAHALRGSEDPEAVTPLLRSYALRYPRVVKHVEGRDLDERVHDAVVVWLRPATG
jgi:deazaflavin-dependent oxidoreductase (nitroreductase family)